jgi:hypothetical protein
MIYRGWVFNVEGVGWMLQIKPTAQGGPPRVEKGVPLVGAALTYLAHPVKMLEWAHLMVHRNSRTHLGSGWRGGGTDEEDTPRHIIAHCA